MANLKLNNVVALSETGGVATFGSPSATLVYPSGHVLQVVSYYTATQVSQTITTSDTVVNSMTKDITPKGASSKFLVYVRWIGEVTTPRNAVFNIQMEGTRVNCPSTRGYGLSMPALTYGVADNDATTPETISFQTLVSTSSVIGTDITFRLVVDADGSHTMWNNRCFNTPANDVEAGTSELIITEIAG
jgi:hypothetical protein